MQHDNDKNYAYDVEEMKRPTGTCPPKGRSKNCDYWLNRRPRSYTSMR